MISNFTADELVIRVIPGGVLLATLYFVFGDDIAPFIDDKLDVFYTFLFFCCAFIVGELLQALAHELEFIIDLFFRCRRPSEVFLYKNNPVLNNEYNRKTIITKLHLTNDELVTFDRTYSDIPIFGGEAKEDDKVSQSIFWRLYSNVSHTDEIKLANRNYLFARVIMVDFLIIGTILLLDRSFCLGGCSFILFLLFLWRSRGIARGLVFKTVLLNVQKK